ncbi:hypoxanthine phosphoribosyltransferase [Desulforhopalus vacuolatus]|uniref:hypoxanthine phosphoribosyltransferase n=1 Tax=Desulforhopalus vacuolatus TaxID=40414 RepID=UPI0019636195|nr:hypoxanthine phosphoribosyltransferase [Desulforhopalus vacuolatus]MBM9519426.1 hypoxanthine phosphoribosyltransferase [Desulforhopalus vacuolatus]
MNKYKIGRVLVNEEKTKETVERLGRQIYEDFKESNRELIIVGLLKGSFIFMADLVRAIDLPLTVDFITVSSYGNGTVSNSNVKLVMDLDTSIEDKDVIIVEDIVDTGRTFKKIIQMMSNRQPHTLKSCSFLSKPSRRVVEIEVDYIGVEIEDEFVVGYGMDYAQRYRNIPCVTVLEES